MLQVHACGVKDLTNRTVSVKIWNYITYKIAKNLKYDGYQRGFASIVYKGFDKERGSYTNEIFYLFFVIL